ncbi:MAG: methyltransferase domain-containing protein [Opitutales bacterium]
MTGNFDQQAIEYHERATIQRDLASWTAEWLEPNGSDLEAVEFGAGTGHFTKLAVRTGMRLRAVDLSPRMVEVGSAKEPKAHWEEGNAWMPADNLRTDRILSSALLQWCPDPAATFSRWFTCLRDDGRILSGLFVRETLPELTQVLPGAEPFTWRSVAEWKDLFQKAGFAVARADISERIYRFSDARALFRYLHRIGSVCVGRFSAGNLRSALRSYDQQFAQGKTVRSTWTFLRIECFCSEGN